MPITINTDVVSSDLSNPVSSIRPLLFEDYIGQDKLKQNLKIFIDAAKNRGGVLDHVLFYGPAGLGKTTLANIIANELGCNLVVTSAPAIEKPGELAAILTKLCEGDCLFIDEIHRLPKTVEEVLYSAMEDFAIDVIIGENQQARSVRLDLPKFTLIGATTLAGNISSPLRDRFGITFRLNYYTESELAQIAERTAHILGMGITKKATEIIGQCGRGTPRITNNILKRVIDFATVEDITEIDDKLVLYSLDKLSIRKNGLNAMDSLIVDTIRDKFGGGPVGIETLSACIGEDRNTLENVYEPYLIYKGVLIKTPKGRMLNNCGKTL